MARALTRRIYTVTRQPPFGRDYALSDQLRRASISVMANLAEGFGYMAGRQFSRFLIIARGSCAEVASHLYVAHDIGYLEQAEFESLIAETERIGRMISSLYRYLEQVKLNAPQRARQSIQRQDIKD